MINKNRNKKIVEPIPKVVKNSKMERKEVTKVWL
jgi:hypothetical protein